jgi:DNA invertase Pin-like site-specific DNA recombinase
MIAVWSSDRLGRSLSHLVEVLQTIRDTGTGIYIHTQAVDTTTPAGRALFGMLGVFAEFEREMIVSRVNAGLSVIKAKIKANGKFISKAGKVRTRLGRPGAKAEQMDAARVHLSAGRGIRWTAGATKLGVGTVHRLKREMAGRLRASSP